MGSAMSAWREVTCILMASCSAHLTHGDVMTLPGCGCCVWL